jgi:sugar transferase EpsL
VRRSPSAAPATFYRRVGKRLLDLALTIPVVVVAAPLVAALACLVAVRMGRPVFFLQRRPGLSGEPFTMVKLRTMRGEPSGAESDEARLTGLGRFLRRWSLDELPGLLNVLRGEMSLVGPRPLLMEYLPLYDARQRRRHEVLPGVTGWAQVNGRNAASWPTRLELDVWYTENVSLRLDLAILARTALAVVAGTGVSSPGRGTAPRFRGSAE